LILPTNHENSIPTVDVIIQKLSLIFLVKEKNPYEDTLALPSGFVESGEKVEQVVIRVVEEISLKIQIIDILVYI
jgi:ADP-ribose pyrophosphatase YjhB (NUDIX family)